MNPYKEIEQTCGIQSYKKIRNQDGWLSTLPRILREISWNESFESLFRFELFLFLASIKDALVASE